MTTYEDFISKLNPKVQQKVRTASEVTREKLALPSLGLTRALDGGLVYGTQTILWGNRSGGKAQPVDTLVPTPKGYRAIGDLAPGDYVFGSDGRPTLVTGVFPQGICDQYRVRFNDGTSALCNDEHLWTVQTHKQRYGVGRNGESLSSNWRTVKTSELIPATTPEREYGDAIGKCLYKTFLPLPDPVEYTKNELEVEPYLMGLYLGDGCGVSGGIVLSMNDIECINEARRRSEGIKIEERTYSTSSVRHWRVFGLNKAFQHLGVKVYSYEKRIPRCYMESSVGDRLWLLRGLMDSDGSQERGNRRASLSSTSFGLASDVAELVRSLGGVARIDTDERQGRRNAYEVQIWTPQNPFFLPRKAEGYNPKHPWFKAVVDVVSEGEEEMVCISVENIDGLYLTNDYVVTHNTGLALGAVAIAQREGKVCGWIDSEKQFDPIWAQRLGVDTDSLLLSRINTVADCTEVGMEWLHAGIDVIVLDSYSMLLPQSYFEGDEIKGIEGTNKIGSLSQDLGKMVSMFAYANVNTNLIMISQVRNQFGKMHASLTMMGGKALEHGSTVIIKLFSSLADAEQIRGDVSVGDLIFDEKIGRKVNWIIEKDRGPGMGMDGDYPFYYKGDFVGVDVAAEILNLGVKYGKITKGGSWYTIYGEKIQSEAKAARYLRENPEIQEKLYGEILNADA